MKAIQVTEAFGLENLHYVDLPDPEPGPGQVLLAMRAASLNYRDLLMVRGHYNPEQPLPLVPCSDGAGEVIAVGPGVTRFAPGDRAVPIFAQGWLAGEPTHERMRSTLGGPLAGTLSQFMVVSEQGLVRPPEHLSDAEAACLPCAAVTAWNACVTEGDLKPGQTVLIQGTGGVSIFALQFATLLGARAIVTSSSDAKLERARELGAWQTLNYREVPKWSSAVREMTDGRGVDLVVEVGGAGTFAQSLRAVRMGGIVATIGVLAGVATELSVIPILMQRVRVQGILVGDRESFEAMNRAISAHELRPIVDRSFPLTEARGALEHLASGSHFGKVVIDIPAG